MQLHLNLIEPPLPRLADGVPGGNTAALTALQSFLRDDHGSFGSLLLWGGPGSGKSFWLRAWAHALGPVARFIDCAGAATDRDHGNGIAGAADDGLAAVRQSLEGAHARPSGSPPGVIWLIDNADQTDEAGASLLFRLYNAARERDERIVVTASAPPLRLTMRDDLRTRIAQGLVFELTELTDDEKKDALRDRAARLGMPLNEELMSYMLTRLPRNLGTLSGLIDRLNDASLAQKRPVTLPLLKELIESLDARSRPV